VRPRSGACTRNGPRATNPIWPAAIALVLAAGLVFSGCSKRADKTDRGRPAGKRPSGSPPPFALPPDNQPATYIGTFDDTPSWSERWTVWLRPDSTYFLREEHVGHGDVVSDHFEDDVGHWERATDGGPIRLSGGRNAPIEFDVPHPDTLVFRDSDPLAGGQRHYLVRSPSIAYFEPRVNLTGYFRYTANAALFDDCDTHLRWPVLMEENFRAAEAAYGSSGVAPGNPLLVSLEGRVVRRPGVDNGPPRDFLIIEKFARAMAGESCNGPDSLRSPPSVK